MQISFSAVETVTPVEEEHPNLLNVTVARVVCGLSLSIFVSPGYILKISHKPSL